MLGDQDSSGGGATVGAGDEAELRHDSDAPSEENLAPIALESVEGDSGEGVAAGAAAEVVQYGRYRLLNRIGKGGMAEVFLASMEGAQGFRRRCVVKRIRPDKAKSQYFAQMFVDEARITAALHHPNIVQVYEFGEIGNLLFLTMEYLDGKNLGSVLDALNAREKLMAPAMAAYVAQQVARGLHYAHALTDSDGRSLGVIHRDVSPSNIMLLRTGEVKILDFGVAKAERALKEGATVVGKVKGKLSYMAPEQHSGDAIDQRADVFSVGVILWEMLTGEMLFAGPERRERSRRLLRGEPPPPSEVRRELPLSLDAIVLRCLQLAPEDRYASAGELAEELGTVVRQAMFDANDLVKLLDDVCGEYDQDATVVESTAGAHAKGEGAEGAPKKGQTELPKRVVTREFGATNANVEPEEAATANFKRREPMTAIIPTPSERFANIGSALVVPVLAVAMALLPLAPRHADDPAELTEASAAPVVVKAAPVKAPVAIPAIAPPEPALPAAPVTIPVVEVSRRPSVVDVGRTPPRAKVRPPARPERARPSKVVAKSGAPARRRRAVPPVELKKLTASPEGKPELHVRDPFATRDLKLVDPF